jgi:hypothetical protein
MSVLGVKTFWRPLVNTSSAEKDNQVIKNMAYINLQILSVNYMSIGSFWQNTFGGNDNIALATTLKYQSGGTIVEATAVQDNRKVKAGINNNLALKRNIGVKIPANADALTFEVKMTVVKDDLLHAKFDMLNKPEYQSALQLAPTIVGQIFTVTSLVKKLFTDTDPNMQLEASYATIISSQAEDSPVSNGKLTKGLIILIATNDGEPFDNIDETKFELRGTSLYYAGKEVENTYVIFNISADAFRGDDETADWFKKYNEGLNNLDKLVMTTDAAEIQKIYNDSKTNWIEGNALIDADAMYINTERIKIKGAAFTAIEQKYKSLIPQAQQPISVQTSGEILTSISGGTTNFGAFKTALPLTGGFIDKTFNFDHSQPVTAYEELFSIDRGKTMELLEHDTKKYVEDLKNNNMSFKNFGFSTES